MCYPAGTLDSKTTPPPAREDQPPMTAIPGTVEPPDHPLHQLTTSELSGYRRKLVDIHTWPVKFGGVLLGFVMDGRLCWCGRARAGTMAMAVKPSDHQNVLAKAVA